VLHYTIPFPDSLVPIPRGMEFALVGGSFDSAEREREQLICSSSSRLHAAASDDNELHPNE
jgi:hypothetical protein